MCEEMVEIEVEISDEDFRAIAEWAHERDITFNQMVNIILQDEINQRTEAKEK